MAFSVCFAEEEGFEPPNPFGSTVFKTAAINHSAIPPFPTGQPDCNKCHICISA